MGVHPIEKERLAKGLSRRKLARVLGVSHVTVWRWETQQIIPELPMLAKLSQFFGVPALELAPALSATFHCHHGPDPLPPPPSPRAAVLALPPRRTRGSRAPH